MPTWESLAAFSLASLILIVVPGPSVLFVIGRSLSQGRRGGLLSVLGNELGGIPLVIAVAFGVGKVVASSIVLFTALKIAGAVYLAYLGIQAIRHRKVENHAMDQGPAVPDTPWRTIRQGFLVGVTNPKSIVFFVAVLPQFVNVAAGNVAGQMIVLGILFLTIAFISDSAWALVAGAARNWFASSPERMSRMGAAGGGMMVGLGGVLLLSGTNS